MARKGLIQLGNLFVGSDNRALELSKSSFFDLVVRLRPRLGTVDVAELRVLRGFRRSFLSQASTAKRDFVDSSCEVEDGADDGGSESIRLHVEGLSGFDESAEKSVEELDVLLVHG